MSIPATMRALQQTSLNGPQDLRLITGAPVPVPGPGEVLIRVAAAGVNFGDIAQAYGTFLGGPQPPYLAGFEAAGEIVATGEGVTGLEPGTRVIGVGLGCGAFAEYTALPAVSAMPLPPGWTEQEALGLMVNWLTALAALRPLGGITAGQTVLIPAAAGATGQAAVKLARHYGATVIATASPGKHETVRALGADHVLDSRAPISRRGAAADRRTGADLVLESAGRRDVRRQPGRGQAGHRPGRRLRHGGRRSPGDQLGADIQAPGPRHRPEHRRADAVRAAGRGELMGELFALMAAGVVTPGQPAVYELADGPKALAELEARATVGKLALLP